MMTLICSFDGIRHLDVDIIRESIAYTVLYLDIFTRKL